MSTIIEILTAAALILSIIIPGGAFLLGERNKKRYKKSLAVNCFFFFGTLLVGTIAMFAGAQNVQAATDAAGSGLATGLGYLGAALVTGLSGIGSGIAVASSASAALGAISEDGSLFGKSMIFVAMAEGIALYGLIISFMILGKPRRAACPSGWTVWWCTKEKNCAPLWKRLWPIKKSGFFCLQKSSAENSRKLWMR